MKHLALFNGVGGFQLAAAWCGWENVAHVEIDDFCNKVVSRHFPESICHTDIKQFDGTPYRGQIDIISGGFPCQPYSIAGLRKGNDDDRALWPEMRRVIKELDAPFVVGENVTGASDMELHNWKVDLEEIGYEVTVFDIPASACGLPTMERHIWIVASSDRLRLQGNIAQQAQERSTSDKFPGSDTRIRERRIVCESRFCRVGERVSRRLDKTGKRRLHGIGNAIPPYVAFEIFKAIDEVSA